MQARHGRCDVVMQDLTPTGETAMLKRAAVESTAEAYLELLAARGVEYLFANAGTDFAPLIEAYAKRGAQGQASPRPITVPHEVPAVAMAHGYAMVTGRPQVVMVHVIVGAGNAVGGIINAARSNVPMLMSAGRNPITEAGQSGSRDRPIHWAQEPFDPASMVREFVKWDYELRSASDLETVVDRALTLTQAEPQGPVYLTLPREVLAERREAIEYADPPRMVKPGPLLPSPESVAPWRPALKRPLPDARIVHLAVDPLFSRYPLRGFPTDLALAGTPRLALQALAEAVERFADGAVVAERRARWTEQHTRQREAAAARARAVQSDTPIDMAWLSRCVGDLVDEQTIVVNEYDLDATQACFRVPGSYFNGPASSSLGWGLGAALGVKLAAPDKTVICTVGDGAYIFGAPTAAHFVARAYDIPVLFIVFNNRAWNAVKRAVHGLAPDGWTKKTGSIPLSDLEPAPDYELVCRASGGHAERVEDPAELPGALARALRAVREEKRQALLNVICKKP